MGLDMYLNASYFVWSVGNTKDEKNKRVRRTLERLFVGLGIKPRSITFEAIYWRKANMIHDWFVKNVQGGEDDCGNYYVDREQLEELYSLIKEVLEYKGKSNAGEKAQELLPTQEGFFFGGTEYDEYYWEELERTKKELRVLLDNKELEEFDFEYTSSW